MRKLYARVVGVMSPERIDVILSHFPDFSVEASTPTSLPLASIPNDLRTPNSRFVLLLGDDEAVEARPIRTDDLPT
jgi:hypothetical protein